MKFLIVTTLFLGFLLNSATAKSVNHRIIFDTDSAFFNDDGAALTMLLHHRDKIEILGITVVAGNHWTEQGAEYMLHILDLMRSSDIPLYLGAYDPLVNTPRLARIQEKRWGKISFQGAFREPREVRPPHGGKFSNTRPQQEIATSFIIETIEKNPNQVTILAIGPMTNIAMALRLRPKIGPKIKSLVFMGGNARVAGNATPYAEFNFWFDPEAAAIVLHSDIPNKVMFGLDITNHAPISKAHFDEIAKIKTPITELFAYDMGNLYPGFYENPTASGFIWDCLAAGYLLDPTFVTASEVLPIDVNTTFGPAYGGTFVTPSGPGGNHNRVQVMLNLDFDKFFEMYRNLLTRPVPGSPHE